MPRKATTIDPAKNLQIKISSLQRLAKEHQYYRDEVTENEGKLAKMKADKADSYDIKKFQEVLDESNMMVPDSKSRLERYVQELSDFLTTNPDVDSLLVEKAEELVAEFST